MGIDYSTIIMSVINLVLLFAVLVVIYKGIQVLKNFVNRNKEMDKKIDIILNKLENREDN
ncbi:hypothetical protein [Clostridium vincentii]|uniref:Uncharacterized protein n=1 Tax=Clostridium vincentii TaxID=52704 RepID=A0A2T0B7I3_9CLOT|nr:hypothetical protein [Clostridium vincentii]PRR79850.1 hypothetical protein CLVI_31780 [Clostridium vincentii]